ncbi:MAG: DUF2953 domain-containing protein [Candidatus Methanoperedens sp.]|nr:DUF2953 domain-containing protein [Candidatus Methanoperedens sp.]
MIALIIAVLAVLALSILLFPVNISFNSTRSEGTIDGSMDVNWMIFLFIYSLKEKELKIHIFGRSISRHISPEKKPQVQKPEREIKKSRKMPPVRDFLNIIGPMFRLFRDMVHTFRIKYYHIEITYGLNDPANTGIMTGFMHAVRSSLKKEKDFKFTPDFTKQILDWSFMSKASITPIKIVIPLAKFAANRKVLRFALQIT